MSTSENHSTFAQQKEAAKSRRKMARKLREARDKISETQSSTEFDYDLLQMFVKNELKAFIPVTTLLLATAGIFTLWAPQNQVLLWVAAIVLAKLIAITFCYQFNKLDREEADASKWMIRIASAEFLYGCTWAYVSFLSVDDTNTFAKFFIAGVVITSISIRLMASAAVKPVAFAGTIPIATGLIISSTLANQAVLWAMTASVLVVYLIFIVMAQNLRSNMLTALKYRAEKDYLISEIEEAKAFSDEARRQAEEANIAKSRFLATMSHELRTPLNAILGFSEVMKDELLGKHENQTYKEYAKDIHDSGQHLLNLINEILDLSRIEAGRYDLHEESFRLSDVAVDCCRLLRIKADKKNVQIIENYDDQKTKVWADERAVRQVILNLLSNAVKFTPSGGMIILSIELTEENSLSLSVKDTGPGIPKDEIPTILSNFGQGSLAHETAEGGSGLGLPIVKALVDMHEGTFNLTSELRKGTQVSFTLPSSRVTQILPQLPVEASETTEEATNLLPFTSTKANHTSEIKEDKLIKDGQTADLPVKTA